MTNVNAFLANLVEAIYHRKQLKFCAKSFNTKKNQLQSVALHMKTYEAATTFTRNRSELTHFDVEGKIRGKKIFSNVMS